MIFLSIGIQSMFYEKKTDLLGIRHIVCHVIYADLKAINGKQSMYKYFTSSRQSVRDINGSIYIDIVTAGNLITPQFLLVCM